MNKKFNMSPKLNWITDYKQEDGITILNPQLVKVEDGFYMFWQEFFHTFLHLKLKKIL